MLIVGKNYESRNKKVLTLIDKSDFFLLYEIKNLKKILPSLKDNSFYMIVKNDLFEISKYEVHKDLLTKIQKKQFTEQEFSNLSSGSVNNLKINSIKDTTKFTSDSVKLIYSLGLNSFSLISDDQNNVYLVKVKNIYEKNLNKDNKDSKIFVNQTDVNLRDNLYNSYDFLLNEKYKININQKTLERMKNYFR